MRKTGINKKCLYCDKEFYVPGWRLKDENRGKYCSKTCSGKDVSKRLNLMPPIMVGVSNPKWKGDKIGYFGLHSWVRRNKGRPTECENCKTTIRLTWSNKSRHYKRNLNDW